MARSASTAVLVLVLSALALAAPPKEEPASWKVKPDPLPWKLEPTFPEGKAVPLKYGDIIFYPSGPSPFAATHNQNNKKEGAELKVIDLRTLELVGKPVRAPHPGVHNFRLSPWGDLIASIDTRAAKPTVVLLSVTGEAVVPQTEIWDGKLKVEAVDFAGPGQILTVKEIEIEKFKPKRLWEAWDVKTGKQLWSFNHQLEYSIKWIGYTPGRRYMIMQETGTRSYALWFRDLQTGELAGKLALQDGNDKWGACGGISCSPNGKEAALIWKLPRDEVMAKIMRFDLEKGAKIGEHHLKSEFKPWAAGINLGGMATFQFLPDGRGWLVSGHQILDRETGAVVWAVGPAPKGVEQTKQRRFIGPYQVTDQARGKGLTTITLPKTELDAAFRKARAGEK